MTSDQHLIEFHDVDRARDPSALVQYLGSVSALDTVRAYKHQTYALLEIGAGAQVLDAGCGTGEDARALAQLVGPGGRVVGVDSSDTMLDEARRTSEGLDLPLEFLAGDIQRLDFDDASFDACRADRVLQHVEEPVRALAELVRVARPRSWIVVSEPDWGTLAVDAPDEAVTRTLLKLRSDAIRNGWIGRQLLRLCQQVGLGDLTVIPVTVAIRDYSVARELFRLAETAERAAATGAVAAADARAWLADLEAAARDGHFFSSLSAFIVRGRTPA